MKSFIKITTLLFFIITMMMTGSEAKMDTQIKETTLKNGLKVLIKPVSAAPVVSVFIWYKVGSRNEPAGQSGLAHFLEHMLFKGTKKFEKGEISRLIGRTGGQQNAFTSYDYTAYYETVPKAHVNLALEIEADRMRHAIIEKKEVEAEKTVILSELDGGRNHPQVRLRELVNAHTWIHHPYRRPVIGWKSEVAKLSADQLQTFYNTYYQPNNATLVIVGDVSPTTIMQEVRKHFAGIKKGPEIPEMMFNAELGGKQKRVELHDDGPTKLCRINIPIPNAKHGDHFPLTVLNDVLVKGKTSRLYKALVDSGLATDVSAGPYEMLDKGYWTFNISCTPNSSIEKIETVLFKELELVKQKLLNDREFKQAVNQTKAQLIYAKDSLTDQAMMLGFYETVADDYHLPDLYPKKVAQVTKSQVQQVAKQYLNPEHMTIGWFIPKEKSSRQLGAPKSTAHQANYYHGLLPDHETNKTIIPGPTLDAQHIKEPPFIETATRKQLILDNGLTVILQTNTSNPMVTVSGIIDAGQIHEPKQLSGLAMLHARLLDKGNQYQTAEQIASSLEFKGSNLSFQSHLEYLGIQGDSLSEDFELLIKTMAQCLTGPSFTTPEIKKAAKKLAAQSQIAEDNAQLLAWKGFYQLAYPKDHPMQRSILDAKKAVDKIKRQELINYHQQLITPEKTILSISGDFNIDQANQVIKRHFKSWAKGKAVKQPSINMAPVNKSQTKLKIMKGKHESLVVMGHEGLHRLDQDYYKLFIANHVLGGSGLSSQLMRIVRDQYGLTYGIYSYMKLSKMDRPWCVVFQADPNKVNQAIDLTKKEIKALQAKKYAPSLLADAKEQLVGRLVMNLETNSGLAYLNREIAYHRLGWSYMRDYSAAIRAVSYNDMVQSAKQRLHADRLLISIAGPAAQKVPVSKK